MHQLLAKQYVASIKRRASQGDCPTEAPLSVEALEDLVLTLDALSSIPEQGPGVKPLEWFTELDHLAVAISPVGVWRVWNNLVLETPAPQTTKRYDNLDEAKAAAQADYEARIRSALIPSHPAAVGVTDEMVEAIVQAVRPYTHRTLFLDEHRDLVRTALRSTP